MTTDSSEIKEGGVSIEHRNDSSTSPTVAVTSVGDLRTHDVREIDVVPAARLGRYPTLCGEMIAAASMAEPANRRCPRCAELREHDVEERPQGFLRRLVGR